MAYKYRVYAEAVHGGREYGKYTEYDKAEEMFNSLVESGEQAVHLQELDPKWGWVERDLKTHITAEFKARKEAYWKAKEENEEPWHTGDAPWKAPGMSIHDFI